MQQIHNRESLRPLREELRHTLTPAEASLWKSLRRSQVCGKKFRRQHSVGPFILDFYCPECRLAVEFDGQEHFYPKGWEMPGEVRRRAKAINFGIIYGISAFGLANQLGIEREEAGAYIKKYFERFPGIRDYIEETKTFARKNGYVTTLFGRKCHYPDIGASNASIRAFNERAAVNARLQGSAADIIRRAMIRMDAALAKKKLSAQMLLQVHDELVFEVPNAEVERTLPVVTAVMVDAPMPALSLSVPLQVEAHAADNWDAAH